MMKKTLAVLVPAMIAAFGFNAMAATVKPHENVNMESEDFGNAIYRAGFGVGDITEKEIFADIYDEVFFDIVDIGKLSVGDAIEAAEGEVEVKTIDQGDHRIDINGGSEEGGVTLYNPEDTNGWVQMDGEIPEYLLKGQAQLSLADKVKVNLYKVKEDGSLDEGYDTVECDAPQFQDEMKKIAEKLSDEFSPSQIRVLLENDLLTEVTIDYVP